MNQFSPESLVDLIDAFLNNRPLSANQLGLLVAIASARGKRKPVEPDSFLALKAQYAVARQERGEALELLRQIVPAAKKALKQLDRYPEPVCTDELHDVTQKAETLLKGGAA